MDIDNFIKLLRQFEIVPWEARRYPRKKKKTLVCVIAGFPQPQDFAPKVPIRPR